MRNRVTRFLARRRGRAAGDVVPPPSGAFPSVPTSGGFVALALTAAATGTHGWTVGHTFKQGDMPAGQGLSGVQCVVKNAWPDGSAKFAVLSGGCAMTASTPRTVSLVKATAPTGAALTTAQLAATSAAASISFGGVSVSWSGADWEAPFQALTAGPLMSSWTYRKPIGSDAHLVAWLEVRLYTSGAVEVLPWIENGYLTVSGATTKSGRITFSLGGTTRYDSIGDANYTSGYAVPVVASGVVNMAAQTRAVLVSGTTQSHWLGAAPGITAQHDRAYLESTKVVPSYRPSSIDEAALSALGTTYSPMRTQLTEGMGATGYEAGIGLLPNTSAIYVCSGDARAYRAVVAEGFSLGSYCIHYRDQATNRPLAFASHPQKSTNTGSDLVPAQTGDAPYRYATSHHPAAAYMPYLLTGWNWFVDEIQFQVTMHYLGANPASRQQANYWLTTGQGYFGGNSQGGPRTVGWQWRTLAMCAAITPDADSARAQYVTALGYNATAYRQIHETGTWSGGLAWARNDLGISWEPGFPALTDGRLNWAPWQDHFITASVGLSWDLEVLTDTAKKADLQWFRDWKYRVIVGMLGAQNDPTVWNYRDAAVYNMYVGTPGAGGTTMAWYANWGDAYADNFGYLRTGPATNTGQTGTDLRGNTTDGFTTSYWGNMQPALAYAVDHGATGAAAARERMEAAAASIANFGQYSATPGWGIKPRTPPPAASVLVAAAQSMSAGQWLALTAANVSTSFFLDPVNGTRAGFMHKMAYAPTTDRVSFVGMGHLGVLGELMYDLPSNTWINNGTPSFWTSQISHGYNHNTIDPVTGDRYYRLFGVPGPYRRDAATGTWAQLPVDLGHASHGGMEWFPDYGAQGGLVFAAGKYIQIWNKATNTWATLLDLGDANSHGTAWMAAYSPAEHCIYVGGGASQASKWHRIASSGTVTAIADCPIATNSTVALHWICPTSGAMFVSTASGTTSRFDGTAWTSHTFTSPPSYTLGDSSGGLVAQVAEHGVNFFVFSESGQVWLYKHA